MKFFIVCAMALILGACDGPQADKPGGPQGKGLDISRYPIQENSPLGGWLAQDYTDVNNVRLTLVLYFNATEAGVALTCSLGNDSITAAAVIPATVTTANSGTIVFATEAQDSVKGTLAGQDYNCNFAMNAGVYQYTMMGEAINVTGNGHTMAWRRIR